MPKVAVIIPARFASTRLHAKPLHPIAGKPLIQRVWERCAKAKGIDTVIGGQAGSGNMKAVPSGGSVWKHELKGTKKS